MPEKPSGSFQIAFHFHRHWIRPRAANKKSRRGQIWRIVNRGKCLGPNMLTTDWNNLYDHLALELANIVSGGICLLATSQIAKLLYLPQHYLIAVITTFLILSVTSWS